jgi:hypothetical protein
VVTSLPVARRTLIPCRSGPFNTLITSTVGRSVGQVSTYDLPAGAGPKALNIAFHTADASPDNKYTFYRIDPSGTVVTTEGVVREPMSGDGTISLLELDNAADDAIGTAHSALATAVSRLDDADAIARHHVDELEAERAQLRADRDPDPRSPAWVTVTDGVALWRCLDFAEPVTAEHRAGIEAALLASGLLTATVDRHGQLTAATGQLPVSPTSDPVPNPLSTVLAVDPATLLPAEAVSAILGRIALDDRSATTWICRDGSWAIALSGADTPSPRLGTSAPPLVRRPAPLASPRSSSS